MSPFTFRKRVHVLPFVWLNFSKRWPPSVTVKVGPFSWNSRSRSTSVDLPGPVNYRTRGQR